MSTLPGIQHWDDAAWRQSLAEQQSDAFLRLRLLLRRRIAWMRRCTGEDPLEGYGSVVVSETRVRTILDPPDPLAEAAFCRSEDAAVAWGRSITDVEERMQERSRALAAACRPFPIDRLADTFELAAVEKDLLWLALAPELDPAFERIYAYAQDDAAKRYATPALAAALFGSLDVGRDPAEALRPGATLPRMALLRLERQPDSPGAASNRILLEPRIAAYLQGADEPDGEPGFSLRPVRFVPVTDESAQAAHAVAQSLQHLRRGQRPPVVNLIGPHRGDAAALAAAVAKRIGRAPYAAAIDQDASTQDVVARLDREATLQGAAYLFEANDEGPSELSAPTAKIIESLRAPVFVVSGHPVHLGRDVLSVWVPEPNPASGRTLWQQALAGTPAGAPESIDLLVHQFNLDPETVVRAAEAARSAARLLGDALTTADVWQACRRLGRRRLGGLAQRIEPAFTPNDMVLPPDLRQQLDEIVAQVGHRALVYESWRFDGRLPRSRGVTALFAGPSGTGKTMAAEVIAGELNLDLYRVDLAGVVNKYIGETEKNLRRVFDAAEESGAVLFFDEADALFGKRTEVRDSHDRYANIEIDYLLQRMEDYRGLAILATNRKNVLDRAFLRRLRFVVDFPFPSAQSRLRIWQTMLPSAAPIDGVDFAALARLELAGGNIQSIAVNAAFLAAADGRVITMQHLMHAASREYAKLDKTPTAAEFGSYLQAVSP